ncbi:MAG TPA: beta-ketoacyl-[acyl-carrier-protein] synthase family protein [Blastocatellia bacterium]|nr:beta-ketoacyl-[acyl-carrier-protein] synthase family protein [Blastocatellia bacterium]
MKRRVVVTGLGAITPLGNDLEKTWQGMLEGRSGVGPITAFPAENFKPGYAAEVKDFKPEQYVEKRKALKMMGRNIQLALAAAQMSVADSGVLESVDRTRMGVLLGTGMLNADIAELGKAVRASRDENGEFDMSRFGEAGSSNLFPLWLLRHIPNLVSSHIAILYGAQGPSNIITTTCTSGAQAIGEAARIIERGQAQVMLAGASDARIDILSMVKYRKLGIMTTDDRDPSTASRPFDSEANGFVCGEGAAVLVLEELDHAKARGAKVYAELVGIGLSTDAYDFIRQHPEGRGMQLSMKRAMKDAELNVDDIDYISPNGASIPDFDIAETRAVKAVFGERAKKVPMSAVRSMIGHTHAACGAIEAVVCVKAINESVVPPTVNLDRPAAECDLDYVPKTARQMPVNVALSNNFGFGGHSASLLFRGMEARV